MDAVPARVQEALRRVLTEPLPFDQGPRLAAKDIPGVRRLAAELGYELPPE